MKILLTGSNGFVGQEISRLISLYDEIELLCTSKSYNKNPWISSTLFRQADLENKEEIANLVRDFSPTHIIHTAAISSVDVCTSEPEKCYATNVLASQYLAEICESNDVHLTFLSTDFVFDGKNGPYEETDSTNPCNSYGESKVKAEQVILNSGCKSAILRTILVYGVHTDDARHNIVTWVKKSLEENKNIRVVTDQWRQPTWVEDLAIACLSSAKQNAEGIFHISGLEMMSIYEIAIAVANFWNLDQTLLQPITAQEINQHENRPRKTGFKLEKANHILNYQPTSFEQSLAIIDEQLKQKANYERKIR